MHKKLITLAALLPFAITGGNVMAEASVSGFADIIYTITDDATTTNEDVFLVDGEVDFEAGNDDVMVRVDVDLTLDDAAGGNDPRIEQGYADWNLGVAGLSLTAGVFNNPVGWEGHDAPDLLQTTHGQIWTEINQETLIAGQANVNSLAGLSLNGEFGMVKGSVILANDIGGATNENSVGFVVSADVIDGLNLELGLLTQDDTLSNTAGDIMDFNATFTGVEGLTLVAEFVTGDPVGAGELDDGMALVGNFDIGSGFGVTARFDSISYLNTANESESTTIAGTYSASDNLGLVLEYRNNDNGTTDTDLVTLEFVGTF